MAINLKAYLHLKTRFIRNYAMICLAGYLLGIGDRHL
jgi:phosphatidylinositol kinase/protein kinase (PI-3  family)